MAQCLLDKERKRLFLSSYNELLYLLQKYPEITPYKLNHHSPIRNNPKPKSRSVSTQTSPDRFNKYVFLNNTDKTYVMTPSTQHSRSQITKNKNVNKSTTSPSTTTSPTVIMSPSPDAKRKQHCNPFKSLHQNKSYS